MIGAYDEKYKFYDNSYVQWITINKTDNIFQIPQSELFVSSSANPLSNRTTLFIRPGLNTIRIPRCLLIRCFFKLPRIRL